MNKLIFKIKTEYDKNKKLFLMCIAGILAVLLIFLSEVSYKKEKKEVTINNNTDLYCENMEKKIENIISSINGAGKTKVMITIDETEEYVYANNNRVNKKSGEKNNDSNIQSDYVLIDNNGNDEGLLLKTIEPKIKGVAIVCEGGDITSVQQEIYSTVSALLNINTSQIQVSKISPSEVTK